MVRRDAALPVPTEAKIVCFRRSHGIVHDHRGRVAEIACDKHTECCRLLRACGVSPYWL
jgi:hypothetical protein